MTVRYLYTPIHPELRRRFDESELGIKKLFPVSWNLRCGDRLKWYYGNDLGVAEIIRVTQEIVQKEFPWQVCLLRKVC